MRGRRGKPVGQAREEGSFWQESLISKGKEGERLRKKGKTRLLRRKKLGKKGKEENKL